MKCVERCCELANKTTQQLYKRTTPCMDDHQFKEEENELVRELSTVCSRIVLKCLYLARIGRPDILWSVNKFARAVTKWTKSCDKKPVAFDLGRSSYKWAPAILLCGRHVATMQIWIVSRLRFCRRLEDSKSTLGLVYFRKSHVCAKKLDVQETDFIFTQFYGS